MSKIRVGIAGLGRSGWNIHANGLADHDGYQVTAVADPVEERQQEAKERFGCQAYSDPESMIEDPNVDLLVVATPSHTHVPLAIAGMKAGKNVVVEKPMALSVAEMDEMMAVAKETGRILTCYQPRRLDADFLTVQKILASGRLGDILLIRKGIYGYNRRADWQMLRKFGGGELSNTGPHPIDQVLQLIGPGPYELFADLKHTIGAGDAEDHVRLTIRTPKGTVADIEVSRSWAFPQPDWLIVGTLGALQGSRKSFQVKWLDPSTLKDLEVDEGPAAGRKYGTGEELQWLEETVVPEATTPPVRAFYDKLRATILEGAPLFVTPESIRPQIELIERARQQTGLL